MELFPREEIRDSLASAEREAEAVAETARRRFLALPRLEKRILVLVVAALVLLSSAGYVSLYVLPRREAGEIAVRLLPPLEETQGGVMKVYEGAAGLFTLVSGEEFPSPQRAELDLSRLLDELAGKVAGAQSRASYWEFLLIARADLLNSTKRVQAQAEDSQESGQELVARARAGEKAVEEARNSFLLLTANFPARFPWLMRQEEKALRGLLAETETYLTEAQKTTRFYAVVGEVWVDLVPTTTALVTLIQDFSQDNPPLLSRFDSVTQKLASLRQELEGLSEELPAGIGSLHADNLAVFSLLTDLAKEGRAAAAQDDPAQLDQALAKFQTALEPVANRAALSELEFWQKTPLLRGFAPLSASFQEQLQRLAEF